MFCLFAFVLCTLVPSYTKNMHLLYNNNSLTTYKALAMAALESECVRRHISQQWLDPCPHKYTHKAKIYMCFVIVCTHNSPLLSVSPNWSEWSVADARESEQIWSLNSCRMLLMRLCIVPICQTLITLGTSCGLRKLSQICYYSWT